MLRWFVPPQRVSVRQSRTSRKDAMRPSRVFCPSGTDCRHLACLFQGWLGRSASRLDGYESLSATRRRIWHVAVVTTAARRIDGMMRVCSQFSFVSIMFMTLLTSLTAGHLLVQLVVRPFSPIILGLQHVGRWVHSMTRKARHRSVLKAW